MPTDKNKQYFNYEVMHGYNRRGVLRTRVGDVLTPTFMPDGTKGAIKGLTPRQVRSTGVGVVLANTYHLHMQPGEEIIARLGGIHNFSKQTLPLLTDSGGFQVFSLANIRKISEDGVTFKDPKTGDVNFLSPEKSIQIQLKLGADMMVAFDDVVSLDHTGRERTKEAFERTHRWLERSLGEFQRLTKNMDQDKRPLLFGVVQGGLDKELRKLSLETVQSLPVDGIAIGGLSVGETRQELYDMLDYLVDFYDNSFRPRFLLGVGDPVDLRFAIEHGIDMLDCVLPTRNARHGMAWISGDKKIQLTNAKFATDTDPIDFSCDCTTCVQGFSRGFLRHQFKVGEPLAGTLTSIHNIRYLQRICEEYRDKTKFS
ncbi:tRNA guanosine(34) transglycosylase Tgt [Candidatus Saccharibacteria bacterium]|nr:tRNA guanosine(34) transglycosylase Tgt [Candidatus Saccharibacteria bacterium]MBI3337784.1 tRNA guanosine(34) transglycosylase Tgt [Candidatus Saccharibacteria bacterium]